MTETMGHKTVMTITMGHKMIIDTLIMSKIEQTKGNHDNEEPPPQYLTDDDMIIKVIQITRRLGRPLYWGDPFSSSSSHRGTGCSIARLGTRFLSSNSPQPDH